MKKLAIIFASLLVFLAPAAAQTALTFVPLGQCQITSLTSAVLITAANCTRASFTASGSGTNLTTSAVTGAIQVGDFVAGTGVPAGTTVLSQTSGTPAGAGVYVTSGATTSSAASLTSGGIPRGATLAVISTEGAAVRYRDDGQAPTASVGMPLAVGQAFTYQSTLSKLMVIQQASSAVLNFAFYR